MAKNIRVRVGDTLTNFQDVNITRFTAVDGSLTEFIDVDEITGTNIYTVPYYTDVTEEQATAIAQIIELIKAEKSAYTVRMKVSDNTLPAAVIFESRYTRVLATLHSSSGSILYEIALDTRGGVTTAQGTIYIDDPSKIYDRLNAPTGAVVAQYVQDYVAEHGGEAAAGESGATFTPSVSADGTLSWTNDKGLDNPAAVNVKGPQGEQGPKGEKGEKGDTGPAGADGAKGDKGDTGPQGPKGDTGPEGPQGAAGDTGPQGPKGDKGDKGDTGPAGADGAKGEKGDTGPEGAEGYTPVKGVDYFTDDDEAEWSAYIAAELAKRGQLKPEFANDISECTDTTKLYVLPDGFIYAYMKHKMLSEEAISFPTSANGLYRKTDGAYYANTGLGAYTINPPISLYDDTGTRLYDKLEITAYIGANFYEVIFLNNGTNLTSASILGTGSLNTRTIDLSDPLYAEATHFAVSTTRPNESSCVAITDRTEVGWGSTGLAFVPADYEDRIFALEEDVAELKSNGGGGSVDNPFNGKKIGWIGDSITWGMTPTNPVDENDRRSFANMTAAAYGMTIINKGVASSTIARTTASTGNNPMSERYTELDADCDVIVVSGGTNDFGYNVEIGSVSDETNATFYGALKMLCEGLISRYPQKLIVFTTPIKRADKSTNTNGDTLKEYADIIKEVCGLYSLPVLDLWAESGLNPNLSAQAGLFSDGLHPTDEGHGIMSRRTIGYFRQMHI